MNSNPKDHTAVSKVQDPILWVSILVNVLLFAIFSILLIIVTPEIDPRKNPTGAKQVEYIVHGIAALLAIAIAPYLLRRFDQMHHQMSRQNNALDSLHTIDLAISSQTSLDAIIAVAVGEATRSVDGELGLVRLFDNPDDTPTHFAWFNVTAAAQSIIASEEARSGERLVSLTQSIIREDSLDEQWRRSRILDTIKLRNRIVVPILRQDVIYGVMMIGNRSSTLNSLGGFTENDAAVLQDICATVAIAVQNRKLFQEAERRGLILRSLVARTGDAIAASSDAPKLMQILADEAARILGSHTVAVYAFDEPLRQFLPIALHRTPAKQSTANEKTAEQTKAEFLLREQFYAQSIPLDYMAESPNAIFENDVLRTDNRRVPNMHEILSLPGDLGEALQVPGYIFVLHSRDMRPIGLLCMSDDSPDSGTEDSAAFAQALAAQAAVALDNAILSQQTRELLSRTQALQAATHQIAAELDAERALQAVTDGARKVMGADGYSLWAWNERNSTWRRIGGDMFVNENPSFELSDHGQALLDSVRIDKIPQVMTFGDEPETDLGRAWLAIPLIHASVITGVITLHYSAERTFSLDEINLAQSLANQAGNALYNAQLFSELSDAFARERRIAETLQTSLLPEIPKRIGTLQFAEKYQAGHEEAAIGGDIYDLFPLNKHTLGIVMADVTGKGLTAAVQTAMIKYTLRGFALDLPSDPARVLSMTNHVLCSNLGRLDGFVTLFYMVIDTRTGKFTYSVAGHEPPIIRRADGTTLSLQGHSGAPLGCFDDSDYDAHDETLHAGDMMMLYTDGLTEARADDGPFLGSEGLMEIVSEAAFDPDECVDHIYGAVRRFCSDGLRDDVAILVIKNTPKIDVG